MDVDGSDMNFEDLEDDSDGGDSNNDSQLAPRAQVTKRLMRRMHLLTTQDIAGFFPYNLKFSVVPPKKVLPFAVLVGTELNRRWNDNQMAYPALCGIDEGEMWRSCAGDSDRLLADTQGGGAAAGVPGQGGPPVAR